MPAQTDATVDRSVEQRILAAGGGRPKPKAGQKELDGSNWKNWLVDNGFGRISYIGQRYKIEAKLMNLVCTDALWCSLQRRMTDY